MRAVTFYLDMSGDCARQIVGVEGAIQAICLRLQTADLAVQEFRDLSIQSVKVRSQESTVAGHLTQSSSITGPDVEGEGEGVFVTRTHERDKCDQAASIAMLVRWGVSIGAYGEINLMN